MQPALFQIGADHDTEGRDALDRYYTPMPVAEQLVEYLQPLDGLAGPVLEGHVGDGAWVRAMKKRASRQLAKGQIARAPMIFGMDVDPHARGLGAANVGVVGDFLEHREEYQAVVGNPPYDRAREHVEHALRLTNSRGRRGVVAFLLRVGFLGSQDRALLFQVHPPWKIVILTKRPSFTGKGTDLYDYAFVIWDHKARRGRKPVVEWL